MPTRKQRRRRQKGLRHDYAFVTYDDEGNEIEIDSSELRPKKDAPAKAKQAADTKGQSKSRTIREPPAPSWNRSLRRGGLWGGMMLVVVIVFFKNTPLPTRILLGLGYAAGFIPLTYWIDRWAYRGYQRRIAKGAASAKRRQP